MLSRNNLLWRITLVAVICTAFSSAKSSHASQEVNESQSPVYEKELKYPTAIPKSAPCTVWVDPGVKPKAALLCIHGLGLHKGTFAEFGQAMCKDGIVVYALDMRGFGEFTEKKERAQLDFDGCLSDIKAAVEQIRKDNPDLPVVILGESMGGAIALRSTALYSDLIDGLISSVPAGDRFSLGSETKIGLSAIFDSNKPVEGVGEAVIEHATEKPELRRRWKSDPLARLTFTAKELLQFNSFMNENFEVAQSIKNTPILFIQGANDRLVRPAGTWKLFDRLATAKKQLVVSKTSEHLIFEEGQFSAEDLQFVKDWLDRNVSKTKPSADTVATLPPATAVRPTDHTMELTSTATINYWIELCRGSKIYRCNNKMQFRSGDMIRFHVLPESDGYAYLLMRKGSSGKSLLLFPNTMGGTDNFLQKGRDYAIPTKSWMQFDSTPGTEILSLIFSQKPIEITPDSVTQRFVTCYVSPYEGGAKDIVPTRMKLTWNDPKPVLVPYDFTGNTQIEKSSTTSGSSLVHLATDADAETLAVDVGLMHQ